jgi:hypothetical protein
MNHPLERGERILSCEGGLGLGSIVGQASIYGHHQITSEINQSFNSESIRIIFEESKMSEELNQNQQQPKQKRAYVRKQPTQITQQPIAPSPQIVALESGIVPLVNQRLEASQKVRIATANSNLANSQLQAAQSELGEIEQEINYRMQLIAQLKNGGMPVPQQP